MFLCLSRIAYVNKSIKINIKQQNNAIGHHAIGEVRLTKKLLVVRFY